MKTKKKGLSVNACMHVHLLLCMCERALSDVSLFSNPTARQHLPFGKLDIQPCILYKQNFLSPGLSRVLVAKTDCMEMLKFQNLNIPNIK